MNADSERWVVFDLIGVLAEPSWRDISARRLEDWDAFKTGARTEDAFWSDDEKRVYRTLLSFRQDRLDYVRQLKRRGYKIAVATNFARAWLDHLLDKVGDRDLFDARIVSEEVGVAKPHDGFWSVVLDKAPKRSIFVDDRKENCVAAEKAGLHSIWAHPACSLEDEVDRLLAGGRTSDSTSSERPRC